MPDAAPPPPSSPAAPPTPDESAPQLQRRARSFLEALVPVPLDSAWVHITRTRTVAASVADDTPTTSTRVHREVTVTLAHEGRRHSASSSLATEFDMEAFLAQAVADLSQSLPDAPTAAEAPLRDPAAHGLDLLDPALARLDLDRCSTRAQAIASTAPEGAHTHASESRTAHAIATSGGAQLSWHRTEARLRASLHPRSARGQRVPVVHERCAIWLADTGAAHQLGTALAVDAAVVSGSRPLPSGTYRILVHPRAACRLIDALARYRPSSAPEWPSRLSLVADPLRPRGLASATALFDGRPTQPRTLIEGGHWRDVLGESEPGALAVSRGPHNLAHLLSLEDGAVLVSDWTGGHINPRSGRIVLGIRAQRVVAGQRGRGVCSMVAIDDLQSLFGRLSAVGCDPWPFHAAQAPTLVFDGVHLAPA